MLHGFPFNDASNKMTLRPRNSLTRDGIVVAWNEKREKRANHTKQGFPPDGTNAAASDAYIIHIRAHLYTNRIIVDNNNIARYNNRLFSVILTASTDNGNYSDINNDDNREKR